METYTLIALIKKLYPVLTFLYNRYFPEGKHYYSEKALIETKKKGRKIAPFVVPVVGGIALPKQGYKAELVDAPFIAPKMAITAEDLAKKAFGEAPNSGRSPAERQNEVAAEHADDLRNMIYRRFEEMAGEIITTGKVTMKHYATADDAVNDRNASVMELRYYDDEFTNEYKFKHKFSTLSAQEKMDALFDMAIELNGRGIKATDLVLTADVTKMLLTDPKFLDYYNKLRVESGTIDPKTLPEGVVWNGTINLNGVEFTIFTYDNKFEDLDGTLKTIFPIGTIAMLTPGMGTTAFAQVTFVQGNGFVSHAEEIVPRIYADEKNNVIEVQDFSRPVPFPIDVEGWLVANAYADGTEDDPSVDTAKLASLSIGSLTLTPSFDADVASYTASTTNATNTVTATGAEGVSVAITVNDTEISSGDSATWDAGENTVTIVASGTGMTSTTYTVTVTKS